MPVPALFAAGMAIQAFGTLHSNIMQGQAEVRNAQFYYQQAQFAEMSKNRELRLAGRHYSALLGKQTGAYAKGGVSVGSGSSAAVLAMTEASRIEEFAAIEAKGALDKTLASARGDQAASTGALLQNPLYNAAQIGGSVLTNLASIGYVPGGSNTGYGGQGPMSSTYAPPRAGELYNFR